MNSRHFYSLSIFLIYVTVSQCIFPFSSPSNESPDDEWTHYHTQKDMEAKLAQINKKCPKNSKVYSIGKSVQGRELVVIEFSTNPGTHEACKFFELLIIFIIFTSSFSSETRS